MYILKGWSKDFINGNWIIKLKMNFKLKILFTHNPRVDFASPFFQLLIFMSLLLYFFYKPNILLRIFYHHWMCENVSLKSHILFSDFCHGCSWMGIYYFCLRLQISEHTIYAKPPGNSRVAHLKSTQATRVTSVALHWQTLTWSVVDGMSWTVLWLYLPAYNNNYVIKSVTDNKIRWSLLTASYL